MPHISIAAEKIASFWGFPVTNSLLTTWIVMICLTIASWLATRKISIIPSTSAQSIAEILIGGLYDFFKTVTGKQIKIFFPLLCSIFIFVIVSNWAGLLPGVGTIGFVHEEHEDTHKQEIETTEGQAVSASAISEEQRDEELNHIRGNVDHDSENNTEQSNESGYTQGSDKTSITPFFRAPTADLNTTLAIAIIAVISIQYFGFVTVGGSYVKRFIDISNPINFFIGALEIVSELSKIISFAFRLFGNIFAGEVLLVVIAFLMPFIAPLPFLTLELFVGFIQALVFSMLTAVFLNVAVSHGEHEAH